MKSLLALPPELVAAILACLDPHSLLAAAAASRLLARIVAASSRLQYTLSLAKHRLLDISPSAHHPPYATRLGLLRDREQAWSDLRWKARHTLRLPPTGSVYEFVGGIYGNGREDDNRVTDSISFLELPTASCDPTRALRTWTHATNDVTIIDFTMDPSQDLLVLVAVAPLDSKFIYNLHLRTISTNEPHPRAPLPILYCLDRHPSNPPQHELFAAVRVQVSGHLVGLLIKEAPDPIGAHLQIWNWENDPHYPAHDFTFLSRSAFLTVLPSGKFVVYCFPDPLVSPAHPSSPSGSCEPVEKYIYEFPELTNGYLYWYISMSCNPAPGYVPYQGDRAMNPFPEYAAPLAPENADGTKTNRLFNDAKRQQLYYPLPDERIHACCIYIFNPHHHHPVNLTGINNNNTANGNPTNANNAAFTAAGGTTQNAPANAGFLTDDELDEENQQVHSFVFFMNLKNLLDPPDEWLHWQDKQETTTMTASMVKSLLAGLPNIDGTVGMSLESSLNALNRRQEEKELHDAKDGKLNALVGGSGVEKGKKKKKKNGGSLSSLSVEIPIGGTSARAVARSKSLLSTMMATTTTSGSSSLTYPPFPTFSSPTTSVSSTNGSKRNSFSRDTDGEGDISRASSLEEVEDMIMAISESPSSLTNKSSIGPLHFGSLSRDDTTNMTFPSDGATPSSTSTSTSASDININPTTTTNSTSTSTSTSTSPNKTRSASTPPMYTSHNHDYYDYASSSSWRNNSSYHHQQYQDVNFPGGFSPSSSFSALATSVSTQPLSLSLTSSQSQNRSLTGTPTPTPMNQQQQQQQQSSNSTATSTATSASTSTSSTTSTSTTSASTSTLSSSSAEKVKKKGICIPWDVWGPSSTRWFEERLSTDWQHAIYGLRTVESVSVREGMVKAKVEERNGGVGYQEEKSVVDKDKGKGKEEEVIGKGKGKMKESEVEKEDVWRRDDDRAKIEDVKTPADLLENAAGPSSSSSSTSYSSKVSSSSSPTRTTNLDGEAGINMTNGGGHMAMASLSASSSTSVNGLPAQLRPRRFLRVRDFNPYSLRQAEAGLVKDKMRMGGDGEREMGKGKGKQREMYSSFSPSPPISPTTMKMKMPLPPSLSHHSYSYPFPIHLNINSNLSYPSIRNATSSNSSNSRTAITNSTSASVLNGAGVKKDLVWGKRRVVREPSITPVKGVFKKDVVSWLPYTEVVSEETFEVTDVMMDDCRLLLLKSARRFVIRASVEKLEIE
ncbi:hypothetical protein AGABI1DRAFT_130443 [Agaricus bisporus var. burnettii JB137-S8]|uniref:F-box domain-containing protein n=1 Tax=Agaricus bisporus var. burnettii (strain JB137-S8 / ATCC MYA-4627 / FGSC 10392) TaxID=597362 RepID=K5X353_AGABU|nr:uncharacterized protein AGABI1DRAFT_130443 [Agaricus bisporus var. burnettii JB137-S8]EKM77357.1 hypothetical protein AGABI1DRAFT_130443 [Agaricus bisporus var. burnettii JB137-S8]